MGEGGQGKWDTCGHRWEGGQARVDVHKKILKKVSKNAWVDGKNFKSYISHPKMGQWEHFLKNPGSGL